MEKMDYSKLGKLTLWETDLLSQTSIELIKFLSVNEISTVARFLECMDSNSFEHATYSDTMNEARGLADIFKNKYFGIPLMTDVYLGNPIGEMIFKLPSGDYQMLGIKGHLKQKTTIYTAITRLGFNDKERWKIISEYSDVLDGSRLIDIFQNIVDKGYSKGENIGAEDKVFFNKMLYIVSYWNNKNNQIIRFALMEEVEKMLKELKSLLDKKDELDKKIGVIRNDIQVFEDEIRGLGK